ERAVEAVPDPLVVRVEGGPLARVTTSTAVLAPQFSPSITDYTLRCHLGDNAVGVSLEAARGTAITVGSETGAPVSLSLDLVENQALVIDVADALDESGGSASYWVRCLPHDFPALDVTTSGSGGPPAGWYLTGNVSVADPDSGYYAMILDRNGTPVWY